MVTMTYDIAMACGQDAANRQMRAAGRARWNEDDRDLATAEFERLYPLEEHFEGVFGLSAEDAKREAERFRAPSLSPTARQRAATTGGA